MIIAILGGIGSGKTLSAVKMMVDQQQFVFTNFRVSKKIQHHRLKIGDIITTKKEKDKTIKSVNWNFWNKVKEKHDQYSIYLDEVHNIISSRRAMTKTNILMSRWLSQIRKILYDQPNNNLYIISQTGRKIDIDFRDLTQVVIKCDKFEIAGNVVIRQKWYDGFDDYFADIVAGKKAFLANQYFKYYNTNEMVTFSDAEEYL